MGKQTTITRQAANRLDLLYQHELQVGDVVALNMRSFRQGLACKVIKNTFEENLGSWDGEVQYLKSPYYSNQIKKSNKAGEQVIFLRNAEE